MNKHDLVDARRLLLENWLSLIRYANAAHERECKALHDTATGEPISPPPLRLPGLSQDMINLLVDGIEAALAGSKDPFGIATPRGGKTLRGKKRLLSRQERITAVSMIIDKYERGSNLQDAFAAVAEKMEMSAEAMRDAYYDETI